MKFSNNHPTQDNQLTQRIPIKIRKIGTSSNISLETNEQFHDRNANNSQSIPTFENLNSLSDLNKLDRELKETTDANLNKNFSLANLHYDKANQNEINKGKMFDYMLKKTGIKKFKRK